MIGGKKAEAGKVWGKGCEFGVYGRRIKVEGRPNSKSSVMEAKQRKEMGLLRWWKEEGRDDLGTRNRNGNNKGLGYDKEKQGDWDSQHNKERGMRIEWLDGAGNERLTGVTGGMEITDKMGLIKARRKKWEGFGWDFLWSTLIWLCTCLINYQ
jgi:hypothetical protein